MTTPFQTLRFRLAAWCALALAVVLAVSGAVVYAAVRRELLRHHDEALEEAVGLVKAVLSQTEDCEKLTASQKEQLDRIGHLVLFHEVEGEGRTFYRSADASGLIPPVPSTAMGKDKWFETIPGPTATLRMYSQSYRARSGRRGMIHVSHGVGDIVAPLASLRWALLMATPLAALLCAAGGHWLARRALSPVDEVIRLARDIEASSLSRRLPQPRTRDEIGRLVETFNQMIARLEASFEAMSRFTADASHELRTPLTTMRGAIDVVLARPRDAREYGEALASVGQDVDRLRSIVEDLLLLARADSGRIELERSPVRLDVIACEMIDSFRPSACDRGVSIVAECPEPVVVLGDERWLRQAVMNLLDNAVKFSAAAPEGSRSVRVAVTKADGSAVLSVADSGPGIPDGAIGRVFERFFRADNARAHPGTEGCGLGLAITAWVVSSQGGVITARNRPEGGSLLRVTLPAARD